ncbi:MAG: helix-turn-helix domain-containing protein [Clostridiales bacterium]|nr:helix-turn-helix domain-containing protein [Clostridiales bacterium]
MKKERNISILHITPNLRYINLYQCESGYDSGLRKNHDHYFLYVHKGKGTIIIDKTSYKVALGDLLFCSPNIINRIIADEQNPFLLTGINFDFTNKFVNQKNLYPIDITLFDEQYLTEKIHFTDFEGFPPHIRFTDDLLFKKHITAIVELFDNKKKHWEIVANGQLQLLIALIIDHIIQGDMAHPQHKYQEIITYIQENYTSNLSNDLIATKFHYNPDYINKMIYSYTGLTIKQYIIDLRIRKAIDLLINSDWPINQVSSFIGYNNTYYFSKIFKKKTGFSPTLFRSNILT